MGICKVRPTFYLWYVEGKVFTPARRCLGRYESIADAMRTFPEATFRISADALDNLN